MFGVRTSDRRVVNSSGPADRRVVVNGAGNNSAVVVVNHCEQALDETNEIAVVDASSQVAAPRPYGDVNNGSMLKHVYRYVQNNITLIDSLGHRVEWYKKRLSAKQNLVNQAIRDKQQLEHDHQRANDCQQIQILNTIIEVQDKELKERAEKIKDLEATIKDLDAKIKYQDAKLTEMENLSSSSTSVRESNAVKLSGQEVVKFKKPKSHSIVRNQSKSVSVSNKRTCPVQSKPIPSKKAKSRNKTSNSKKLYELSLLTDDKPYFTLLGDYNPEKDDSVPVKKTSNLEIPSWRVKNFTSWYSMEGTEDMTDDIFKNRYAKLEANERQRKRWDMQRIRELRKVEYLKQKLNKRNHSQDDEKEKFTSFFPKPSTVKMIEITNNIPVCIFGENIYVKKNSRPEKPYHNKWCDDAASMMSQKTSVKGNQASGTRLCSSGCNPMIDCYLTSES